MAIDEQAKKILVGGAWASSSTAGKVDPEKDTPKLTREIGYPQSFQQADGDVITREGANGRWNEIDEAIISALLYGAQPYDNSVDWKKESIIQFEGKLYCASAANGPNEIGGVKTPGSDSEWSTLPGSSAPPDVPSDLIFVNPTPNQLTLRWTPPKDNGEKITSYQVQDSSGTNTTTTYPEVVFTGLTNGTTQSYKVRAYNARGWGDWSGTVSSSASALAPGGGAGFSLQISPGDAQATLTWLEPDTNGASIAHWVIEWKSGSQSYSAGRRTTLPFSSGSSYVKTGLTNGTAYDFRISARNSVGDGPWSRDVSVTPVAPTPTTAAPGNLPELSKTPIDGGVIVNIMPPKDNGARITHYQIRITKAGESPVESNESTTSEIKITGLTNGDSYGAEGRAKNSVGWGPWSGAGTEFVPNTTVPATPVIHAGTEVIDSPTNTYHQTQIIINRTDAYGSQDGGDPTGYELRWIDSTSSSNPSNIVTGSVLTFDALRSVFTDILPLNGKWRHYQLRATNSAGKSGWSNIVNGRARGRGLDLKPGKVKDPRIFIWYSPEKESDSEFNGVIDSVWRNSHRFLVSWKKGDDVGSGEAASYEVRWKVSVNGSDVYWSFEVSDHTAVSNRSPSMNYKSEIQIRGTNAAGHGQWHTVLTSHAVSGSGDRGTNYLIQMFDRAT